jgi:selenocysteine lyase/cysteine desulfurase
VACFAGARPDDVVVFTRNTTDALNLLAGAVPEDGDVVFLDIEHHANLLPWRSRRHRCVPASTTLAATLAHLEQTLAEAPAALLAVTGSSNVTGELLPIEQLARIAHRHGARIVVDAAQLAPHRGIDVAALGLDYVAFSGHKLYAPFGAGVLLGRRDWLDAAPPYLAGGGAVRDVGPRRTLWATATAPTRGGDAERPGRGRARGRLPGARRPTRGRAREARGAPDPAAAPGIGRAARGDRTADLAGFAGTDRRRRFTVAGHDAGRVAAYLSAEHGIGLRDGRFCAHPLLRRLGADPGALRASLGVGSTEADVDSLLEGLRRLLAEGERWSYRTAGGRWVPDPDPRPVTLRAEVAASPCAGVAH